MTATCGVSEMSACRDMLMINSGTARSANSERSLDHPLIEQEVALVGNPIDPSVFEKIPWLEVTVSDTGCWRFLRGHRPDGYCQKRVGGRLWRVHRLVYELLVGPIPARMELDHLCRVRDCCNPAHLEPVTTAVNTARSRAYSKLNAVCRNGHPRTVENTRYIVGPRSGRPERQCLECLRSSEARQNATPAAKEARRRYKARLREARLSSRGGGE